MLVFVISNSLRNSIWFHKLADSNFVFILYINYVVSHNKIPQHKVNRKKCESGEVWNKPFRQFSPISTLYSPCCYAEYIRCVIKSDYVIGEQYLTLYAPCIMLQYVYDVVCTVHHPTICIWRCMHRASSYNMYMTYAPYIVLQYVYDVVCTLHRPTICIWRFMHRASSYDMCINQQDAQNSCD